MPPNQLPSAPPFLHPDVLPSSSPSSHPDVLSSSSYTGVVESIQVVCSATAKDTSEVVQHTTVDRQESYAGNFHKDEEEIQGALLGEEPWTAEKVFILRKILTTIEWRNRGLPHLRGAEGKANFYQEYNLTDNSVQRLLREYPVSEIPSVHEKSTRKSAKSARTVFEALKKFGHDEDFEAKQTKGFEPTDFAAGSPGKVDVLIERAERGNPLWHEDDNWHFSNATMKRPPPHRTKM